ncbi:MAG: pyruvate formate lyase family protein [Anaerostipes sp.]|jgi:hypothetical protein|nr:pyruvate formate lyase family protein [Anaerostipes sp.]MDD3746407.1 pyruvate formate lyase family protein [Anaerostipes sp.]
MNEKVQLFLDINEPYAAGFFEEENKGLFSRFSRAQRRYFESRPVDDYRGKRLYPSGVLNYAGYAVYPECAKTFNPDYYVPLYEKSPQGAKIMKEVRDKSNFTVVPSAAYITVSGYTHSTPHYERILKEGFDSYIERIKKIKDVDMREGLLDLLEGIRNYHSRGLAYLKSIDADSELIEALEQVPFQPARNVYEAIVCWNYVMYLEGVDNVGMIDSGLAPYYKGEDISKEIRELFENVNDNGKWNCCLGPEYNEITKICLKEGAGLRRPQMNLRVTKDMPQEIWDLALEANYSGCGNPSYYNEEMIQTMLPEGFPGITKEDLQRYCPVGCTETCIAGMTNTGGIDGNINLAMIFENYMQEQLPKAATFQEFYDGYLDEVRKGVNLFLSDIWRNHEQRAKYLPNPMRSLTIDDCIDTGLDYNNGGARYNAAVTSETGMINVIDSMLSIKHLIFDKQRFLPDEFLRLMDLGDKHLYELLKKCPHYGVDDEDCDQLAHDFTTYFYGLYKDKKCYRGGKCCPTSHQYNRHPKEGKKVGPTPDGRLRGESLNDSIGALSGKATNGPTAMMLSASKIDQKDIYGMNALNLSINKKFAKNSLEALLKGYMEENGAMVQITITSKEDLLDAMVHPEKHDDLVVRVGGYSEYFNRLTPDLKQVIIERTLHED